MLVKETDPYKTYFTLNGHIAQVLISYFLFIPPSLKIKIQLKAHHQRIDERNWSDFTGNRNG